MAAEARPGRDAAGPEPAGRAQVLSLHRRRAAVSAKLSQGAGGGPEPLAACPPPQLNVHLGSKSKPGSSAAVFLFLFGHVG